MTDADSVAKADLAACCGRSFGPSTGINVIGMLLFAQTMARRGQFGGIVRLGGDERARNVSTIYGNT